MEIRLRADGAVISDTEFRALSPNTSFPAVLDQAILDAHQADPVLEGPQPTATQYQSVIRDGVEQIDGQWFTKYTVIDWTQEQIDAAVAAQTQANVQRAKAELLDTDWADNISVRDTSLTPHLTNTAEWDVYRLALRVIVINQTAVVETWPTRPNSVWSS